MPMPSLPPSINAAKWKSTAKEADPKGAVFAAIGRLTKAHDAVDPKLLAAPVPKTLEDATELRKKLDGHAKLVQEAIVSVDALTKAGDAVLAGLKSDKSKADVTKLLNSILAEAGAYASDIEKTYNNVQADLGDAIDALEAAKKKADAAAEKEGGDDAESAAMAEEKDDKKFFEGLKAKYKSAFNQMRNVGAKLSLAEVLATKNAQFKFRMVSQGKAFGLGMSKNSWGEGELKIARRMSGVASGGKDSKGIAYWNADDKVFVFEGGNVPVGAANATLLKAALKKTIGYAPKVRLQKPGEKGEDSEGPDEADPDAAVETGKAGGSPGTTAADAASKTAAVAQAVVAKLETFKAKFDQRVALGGEDAEKLKSLDKGIRAAAGAGDPVRAKTLLDGLILLLGSAPRAKDLPKLKEAQKAWVEMRRRYAAEVKALAASLDSIYREELATKDPAVVKAISTAKVKLNGTAGLIGPELESAVDAVLKAQLLDGQVKASAAAKSVLTGLLTRLGSDSVFKSLDGKNNELKPDMTIVTDLQTNLKALNEALKI